MFSELKICSIIFLSGLTLYIRGSAGDEIPISCLECLNHDKIALKYILKILTVYILRPFRVYYFKANTRNKYKLWYWFNMNKKKHPKLSITAIKSVFPGNVLLLGGTYNSVIQWCEGGCPAPYPLDPLPEELGYGSRAVLIDQGCSRYYIFWCLFLDFF